MTSKEIASGFDQQIQSLQQEIKHLQDSKKGQTSKASKDAIEYRIKGIRQTIANTKLNKQNAVNAAKQREAEEKERQKERQQRERERQAEEKARQKEEAQRERERQAEEKARQKEEAQRERERQAEEKARQKEEAQRERESQREAKQASKSSDSSSSYSSDSSSSYSSGSSSSYSSSSSSSYSSGSSSSYSSGSSSSYSSGSSSSDTSRDDEFSNYKRKHRSIEDQEDQLIELFEEKVEKAETKLYDKYVYKTIPTDVTEYIAECKYWKAESTKKHAPDPELIDFIKRARQLVNDNEFMEEYEEDAEIMSDVVEARLTELYHHAKKHKELLNNAEVREIFKDSLENDEKINRICKIALYAALPLIVGAIIAWFCISGF